MSKSVELKLFVQKITKDPSSTCHTRNTIEIKTINLPDGTPDLSEEEIAYLINMSLDSDYLMNWLVNLDSLREEIATSKVYDLLQKYPNIKKDVLNWIEDK